ncbi:MAG: hypothetical protein M3279_02150 [Actinomycetota bacterium]|nr:hypothetical protein [Actinomycetota bacterium]
MGRTLKSLLAVTAVLGLLTATLPGTTHAEKRKPKSSPPRGRSRAWES